MLRFIKKQSTRKSAQTCQMAEEYSSDSSCGIACFLDVETTGLSSVSDEVIEIALCLFEFKRDTGEITQIIDEYVGLREPKKSIPLAATRIHGIKNNDVKGKHLDSTVIEAMIHRAEFLVAHNAPFDRGFVTRLFQACAEKPWLCSMRGINWRARGFPSMALQSLLRDHGIKVDTAHRAQHDVKATLKLLAQSDQNGKTYFLELLERIKNG